MNRPLLRCGCALCRWYGTDAEVEEEEAGDEPPADREASAREADFAAAEYFAAREVLLDGGRP